LLRASRVSTLQLGKKVLKRHVLSLRKKENGSVLVGVETEIDKSEEGRRLTPSLRPSTSSELDLVGPTTMKRRYLCRQKSRKKSASS